MAAQLPWRERLEQSSVIPTEHVPIRSDVFELSMPLRAPIAASTIPTFDAVQHLIVLLRADGLAGWGYSAHRLADGVHQAAVEATNMLGALDMDLGALLRFELDRLQQPPPAPPGRPGWRPTPSVSQRGTWRPGAPASRVRPPGARST